MAEPLKNLYNPIFFERIIPVLKKSVANFDERRFLNCVFDEQWHDLELKQRVRHITLSLHPFLPASFPKAVPVLIALVKNLKQSEEREQGFPLIFLADYIEVYGLDHFDDSMIAIEEVTQLVSAEFAIRPFLKRYPLKAMNQMLNWSKHNHSSVRRLSSEGCRPRLPWAMGVPELKKDPSVIIPILENLKTDPSEYVRRSVANNLNDIARDHQGIVIKLVQQWKGIHPDTDKLIRHACRTLLKKGDKDALKIQGIKADGKASIHAFKLGNREVRVGEKLEFRLKFKSAEKKQSKFRLDYSIDYLTGTGKKSNKIFKLKEGIFNPGETVELQGKQSFRNFTTRKHYPGKHTIHILVNGRKEATARFSVL